MTWVMAEPGVMDDDGTHGDEQRGPACSVRFTNPDLPGAVVTVYAYAHTPERENTVTEDGNEYAEYGPDLGSLGVESLTEYATGWNPEDPDSQPEWTRQAYDSLDTRPFNRNVDAATAAARTWIRSLDPERDFRWDGKEF
ncbi:hypothetical protein [Kitasatospora sp. NPDC087315]|uniref:hypothetical protein n=1 Tax=Kitasatospora sp. NPDC087315 TaxID=3364069 RepID=UPI0038002000